MCKHGALALRLCTPGVVSYQVVSLVAVYALVKETIVKFIEIGDKGGDSFREKMESEDKGV